MIVRELIAKLTLDVDGKKFGQADRELGGLKKTLIGMGALAGGFGAALAFGMSRAIAAAGDANETLNLMGIVFEQNTQQVVSWADAVGRATGRSTFELREGVTVLGNALKGMTGDLGQATDMATALAERAVDFGSAMNVSLDGADGAINKFLSGLAGETEPLRRFGINMNVAALEAFALERGVTKAFAKLSEAEKTQLRYAFLMEKTAQFQGDAANTADAYANATRSLRARITDLTTRIGLQWLPVAEKLVVTARNVIDVFADWVERSRIVQAAMIVLGATAAAVGITLLAAFWPVIAPIVLAAAALTALTLIVDDFLVFLAGGDSVIGAFIDSVWGPGSAAAAVQGLRDVLDGLVMFWSNTLLPGLQQTGELIVEIFDSVTTAIGDWVITNQRALTQWVDGVWELFRDVFGWLEKISETLGVGLSASVNGSYDRADGRGLGAGASIATPAAAAVAGSSAQYVNQTVAVTVEGAATPATARLVATDSAEAIKRLNRRTRAAVTQRADR